MSKRFFSVTIEDHRNGWITRKQSATRGRNADYDALRGLCLKSAVVEFDNPLLTLAHAVDGMTVPDTDDEMLTEAAAAFIGSANALIKVSQGEE